MVMWRQPWENSSVEVPENGYDYIIYTEGGKVYAKNGKTGEVEFSGDEGGQILHDIYANGAAYVLVRGEIPIDLANWDDYHVFVIKDNSALVGGYNATLRFYASQNPQYYSHGIGVWGDNIIIDNITLDFTNDTTTNSAPKLHLWGGKNIVINNVKILETQKMSIMLDNGRGSLEHITISNSYLKTKRGIYDIIGSGYTEGYDMKDISIINNYIGYPEGQTGDIYSFYNSSIGLVNGKNVFISNNYLEGRILLAGEYANHENYIIANNVINSAQKCYRAITFSGSLNDFVAKNVNISNNIIYGSIDQFDQSGKRSEGIVITNNTFIPLADDTAVIILYSVDDAIIRSNIIKDVGFTLQRVFYIQNSTNIDFLDNKFASPYTYLIQHNGSTFQHYRSTATFSGDGSTTQFTIAHNLVSTPSKVQVTPMSADAAGPFYVTADATNIYVNYTTAPPSGTNNVVLSWYAEV